MKDNEIPNETPMWVELEDYRYNEIDILRYTRENFADHGYSEYCDKLLAYENLRYMLAVDIEVEHEWTKQLCDELIRYVYDAPIPKVTQKEVRKFEDGPNLLYFQSKEEAIQYVLNQE